MRLLHIADLHAGKTLAKVSRNPDLSYALEQVLGCVKENKVEVVLIAGDVFDKANPDNESKELLFDFFLRLKELNSEVVLISGNHDSYDFMKSIKGISRLAGVHIYDRPSKESFLYSRGDLKVVCLPYPSERVLTSADEESKKSYAQLVNQFIKFLSHNVGNARYKILLAHLFVAGSKYTNTEKEATITQHYAINPSSLPENFDYIALGHVHRYQRIEQAPTQAYYTGTPYQLDFAEADSKKFFNLLLLEKDRVRVEPIQLSLKNPLKVFSFSQEELSRILPEMEKHRGYIKAVVHIKDTTKAFAVMEKLRASLGDKLIKVEQISPGKQDTFVTEGKDLSPLSLYKEYYELSHGEKLPQEVEETFLELLRKVQA